MPVALTNITSITPVTSPLAVNGSLNLVGTAPVPAFQINGAALITGVGVQHAGTAVATQPALNYTDTATATFNVTNDAANNRINISVTAIAAGALADPTTTLGDLIVRGATAPPTRLGVGSNGQVLRADSTQMLGVAWQTLDAANIDLNPVGTTWNTVQDAIEGLETLANTATPPAGAAGQIQFNAGGTPATFGANANLFWDNVNGRLGVDQPAPQAGLDVNTTVWITGATNLPATGAGLRITFSGGIATLRSSDYGATPTLAQLNLVSSDLTLSAGNGPVEFATGTGGVASPRMVITSAGNVGIGTNAPAYMLDVNGDMNLAATHVYRIGGTPLAFDATQINLNPQVSTWTTVQNAISNISTTITTLSRGMAYVGHYDAAAGVATFVPSMSSLDGPLPDADATGIDEGDFLVVTSATAGPPALNVGDQLISGGPTGGTAWNVLPIGYNLAAVTAATVPLAPVIGTWSTVQVALTALSTTGHPAGTAGQIQFAGTGTPAPFAASADLFWDGTNSRLGVGTATPQAAIEANGTIRSTASVAPASGAGVELRYAGGTGVIDSFDRSGGVRTPLQFQASNINATASGTINFQSTGNLAMSAGAQPNLEITPAGQVNLYSRLAATYEANLLMQGDRIIARLAFPPASIVDIVTITATGVDVIGDLDITGDFSINGIVFAEAGSVNMKATSIAGIDGEPLKLIDSHGRETDLDALLARLETLEARFAQRN